MANTIPVNILREYLAYEPETGRIIWKKHSGRAGVGSEARRINSQGYVAIQVLEKNLQGHRIAWALHYGEWPSEDLDHINRVRHDNRICNLRLCDDSTNKANSKLYSSNTSGAKGVSWHRGMGSWRAYIRVRGRFIHLGYFARVEDASAAYRRRAYEEFGEFAERVR